MNICCTDTNCLILLVCVLLFSADSTVDSPAKDPARATSFGVGWLAAD